MKTFQLYKHPVLGFEAVKVGLSWPAFFFGLIWMLCCRLWGKAALWFVLYLTAIILETAADSAAASNLVDIIHLVLLAAYIALWAIPIFQGNAWRASNLEKRGYKLADTVQTLTKDAAIAAVIEPLLR